ncbi:MAG: DsrE family protein [Erysipelotrichales bacterium]|jgi:hypothetical protein|nr:DsrE family protein [Bacilli bacterium]MDD4584837.1 DsrE family protein [Bacilli bacterium]MEA4821453.1 DsrE family protein [Erysipelotrichales bacterium]
MKKSLVILWTNPNKGTALNMLLMYAKNSLLRGWWEEVEVCVWGETVVLATSDQDIINEVKECQKVGVKMSACQACARNYGLYEDLISLGYNVVSYGPILTDLLQKQEKHLLTI